MEAQSGRDFQSTVKDYSDTNEEIQSSVKTRNLDGAILHLDTLTRQLRVTEGKFNGFSGLKQKQSDLISQVNACGKILRDMKSVNTGLFNDKGKKAFDELNQKVKTLRFAVNRSVNDGEEPQLEQPKKGFFSRLFGL